jgi:hypothetical protein
VQALVFRLEEWSPAMLEFAVLFVNYTPGVVYTVGFLCIGFNDTVEVETFAYQFSGYLVKIMIFDMVTF